MTEAYQRPTSDWEHSHAVEADDVLVDTQGERFRVDSVNDDGSVDVTLLDDEHDVTDSWTEEATRTALTNGDIHRERDGLTHELATF
jgi:hypothetical protein